jgi:HEAT repeat protein
MIIVVVVALCAVLSLGKANNERRYDGRSAAAWLASAFDTSASVRMTAAAALDYLWPVAGSLREQIVVAELRLLGDRDARVRDEATAALAGMATESAEAVRAVTAVLDESQNPVARIQAAYVVGAAGAPARDATQALLRAAAARDPSLRVAAVTALGDMHTRDMPVINELLAASHDDDARVRVAAIEALADNHEAPEHLTGLPRSR